MFLLKPGRKKRQWFRTIPGFSANQIFAYFPVWSRCGANSCDPHSDFEWLRGDVRRSWVETVAARSQTSARMSGIQLCVGTGKPATCVWLDRPGRIAGAPWSMQAVTAGAEQVRAPAVEARASQTRRVHNELTSFVLLIIICHPRKRNKGHNHGYSERARRKRRT